MTSAFKTHVAAPLPFANISLPNVKAAVASLGRSQVLKQPNSLEYLELIDEALFSPAKPSSPDQRRFELHRLLVSLITTTLNDYRRSLNLSSAETSTTRESAFEHVLLDLEENHPQLIGWSMLYYLFVRVDLNISREEFTQRGAYSGRTFQRFQDLAERHLTELLYHREAEVRLHRRRERMLARLPYHSDTLFGRLSVVDHLQQLHLLKPKGIVEIFGPEGIGKTSGLREVLFQQIGRGEVDQLIWVSAPVTLEYVRQQIEAQLSLPLTEVQAYAARYGVTLVIANLDVLDVDAVELDALLHSLSKVTVYVLSRKRRMLSCIDAYVALSGLDFTASQELLLELERRTFGVLDHALTLEEMEGLWLLTKGNPHKLKQEFFALFDSD